MTRLEQALRWWRGGEGRPVPTRHVHALKKAGFIYYVAEPEQYDLTPAGQKAIAGDGETP